MNLDFDKIAPACEDFGVTLTDEIRERLNTYARLLVEWNEKMNLTAIVDDEGILYKHFFDCLLFLKNADIKKGAKTIDVGTGAGFPGMVLKIARPDIELTLLDSLNKRLNFLNAVLGELGLTAETVHLRAEEGGKNPLYREQFDIACARAVANLPALCEYCLPYVKKGGVFVAMKAAAVEDEAAAAQNAIKLLGGEKPTIICETLTGNEQRAFVFIKKISQTPTKYPRNGVKISKTPL